MAKPRGAVEEVLARRGHPLRAEIDAVRQIILGATPAIAEHVKWNGPSYYLVANPKLDMASINLHQQAFVQLVLVFHGGLMIASPLLSGDYKDRRLMRFDSLADIERQRQGLVDVVTQWAELHAGLVTP